MKTDHVIKSLERGLETVAVPENIAALYIYGSLIKGKLRSDSDIDIAMLTFHDVEDMERLALIANIEALFTNMFTSTGLHHEVSVFDMRSKYASLQLLNEVVTKGICVYERMRDERLEFENIIKGEYFDFVPFLRSLRKRKYGFIYS